MTPGAAPDLTYRGQLLGDFEVAITGGIWVAAGEYGKVRISSKDRAKPEDEYYYETDVQYIRRGNPEMWRDSFKIYRRSDQKLLGESVGYSRRGGDLPSPMHESSFTCPAIGAQPNLDNSVFKKGDN